MDDELMFAGALAAIVTARDVTDSLAHVVAGCAAAYPSQAVAVLVGTQNGLDLLSASSHRAEELELLQIQNRRGPCVEAMDSDRPVLVSGAEELQRRWGHIGSAILAAGFDEVHAFPMHYGGKAFGGLNIFVRAGTVTDPAIGQLFADLATLAVLQLGDLSADHLVANIHEAVLARAIVEQAKGVLAYQLMVSMEAAYAELLDRAIGAGDGLKATAQRILDEAQLPPNP